jgi:hypothetical protein
MWKSCVGRNTKRREGGVEAMTRPVEMGVRACSACAGDYEDPERTMSSEATEEEENAADASKDGVTRAIQRDEFPAL